MRRIAFLIAGFLSVVLGAVGAFLPLLPTVPFLILAAFCFARSSPQLEAWLVEHQRFGPHILAWRAKGAISRRGKRAALVAFAVSALLGLLVLPLPWALVPLGAAALGGSWIWSRPEP